MALSSNTGCNFTMASGGGAGYLQQAIPLYPFVSSSTSLHNALVGLLLFLFCLPTVPLHIAVAPTVGRPCRCRPLGGHPLPALQVASKLQGVYSLPCTALDDNQLAHAAAAGLWVSFPAWAGWYGVGR